MTAFAAGPSPHEDCLAEDAFVGDADRGLDEHFKRPGTMDGTVVCGDTMCVRASPPGTMAVVPGSGGVGVDGNETRAPRSPLLRRSRSALTGGGGVDRALRRTR